MKNTETSQQVTCKHCKAFNGKSRCGCEAARKERGEAARPALMAEVVW